MNSACELQAAVVTSDPAVIDSVLPCLRQLAIAPSVFTRPVSAQQALTRQKIDAFFVDREFDPELSVLKRMRTSPSSWGAVAFAIVSAQKAVAEASRVADFVMDKPLAPGNVLRTVRAAYGIMLKERKRYFRHSLRIPIHLTDSTYRKFVGETINISETGIALECAAPCAVRETVELEFQLPGDRNLNCKAQIIWKAEQGKTGLSFTSMKSSDRDLLTSWIDDEFHRLQPMPPVKSPAAWPKPVSSFAI